MEKNLKSDLKAKQEKLESRLQRMKDYLQLKFDEEDWHGVADAAMDIREIVSELKCIQKVILELN